MAGPERQIESSGGSFVPLTARLRLARRRRLTRRAITIGTWAASGVALLAGLASLAAAMR